MNSTFDANGQPYQRLQHNINVPLPDLEPGAEFLQQTSPVRKQRLLAVTLTVVLTISTLAIALNGPNRNEFLAPGGLTSVHAQILRDQGHERCATCHGAGSRDFNQWLHDALSGGQVLKDDQSHLCLACHGQTMEPAFAKDPHGMDPERLQLIRARKLNSTGRGEQLVATFPADSNNIKLACSTCHREHHGATFDLTAIDNQKCQSCHLERFDRFEGTHSDFSLAAAQISQRTLGFDHRTHSEKHFSEKGKSFECNQCHILARDGASFGVADFQVACSECHSETLRSTLSSGLVLLRIPSLDIDAIKGVGVTISDWSKTGDFDGQVGPIATLLLGADPEVAELLANSEKGFDFFEVEASEPNQVRNAAKLALAIQRLQFELNHNNLEAIRSRLEAVTGLSMEVAEVQQLVPIARNDGVAKNFGLGRLDRMNWSPDIQLSLKLRQDEELAANPLKGKFADSRAFAERSSQDKLPDDVLSQSKTQNQGQPQISGADSNQGTHQPDTNLQSNPLSNNLPSASGPGESLANNPLHSKGLSDSKTPNGLTENQEGTRNRNALPMRPTAELPEQLPAAKPFFVDTKPSSISPDLIKSEDGVVYRPVIHGDPLLKSWIEFTGRIQEFSRNPVAVTMANRIRNIPEFKECIRCHQAMSYESNSTFANASDLINSQFEKGTDPQGTTERLTSSRMESLLSQNASGWTTIDSPSRQKGFAEVGTFSHRPHLLLKKCDECHQLLGADSINDSNLKSRDFVGITKVDCAGCHRSGQADSHCSHCHSYHQGQPPVSSPGDLVSQAAEMLSR